MHILHVTSLEQPSNYVKKHTTSFVQAGAAPTSSYDFPKIIHSSNYKVR